MSIGKILVERVERASRTLVWKPPVKGIAATVLYPSLFEGLGDPGPAGVDFFGLGVGAEEKTPVVEAYVDDLGIGPDAIRKVVADKVGVEPQLVRLVPCKGINAQLSSGDPGAHFISALADSFGTVGGFALDMNTGYVLAVSNNHVFANCNLAEVGDPLLDVKKNVFGRLERWAMLRPPPAVNVLDGAVGRLDRSVAAKLSFNGAGVASMGLRVHKVGAATGSTTGRVVGLGATPRVSYRPGIGVCDFHKSIRIVGEGKPFSKPGDSGSLVFDDENAVVGLLFAGERDSSFSFACPVWAVTEMLGVAFST